jgi:hypothetical protein
MSLYFFFGATQGKTRVRFVPCKKHGVFSGSGHFAENCPHCSLWAWKIGETRILNFGQKGGKISYEANCAKLQEWQD